MRTKELFLQKASEQDVEPGDKQKNGNRVQISNKTIRPKNVIKHLQEQKDKAPSLRKEKNIDFRQATFR